MENKSSADTWYYLIVRDPGSCSEQFVGFSNDDTNEKFLPAFKTKEDARACFALMPKDIFHGQYDIHAVIQDDIKTAATNSGHKVFVLDNHGKILNQLA